MENCRFLNFPQDEVPNKTQAYVLSLELDFPKNQKNAGDKYRRIRSYEDPDQKGKGKIMNKLPLQKRTAQAQPVTWSRRSAGSG